jgi:hypothetical protein
MEQAERTAVLCVVLLVEVVHALIGSGGTALTAAVSGGPLGTCVCTHADLLLAESHPLQHCLGQVDP